MENREKRIMKRLYKKAHKRPARLAGLINAGCKMHGSDSWVNWWIFDSRDQRAIRAELERVTSVEGWNLAPHAHDCTGQTFAYECEFKSFAANRTFVKQHVLVDC